jgi:hypothetical protein
MPQLATLIGRVRLGPRKVNIDEWRYQFYVAEGLIKLGS